MDIGRKSNIVKISYRDGKIVKKLSLNLDNEHDALFYDSYQRLPSDNRNYMAALYASEQEHGVNDATGHRIQELALLNPKEDTVIMREKRNAELESLKESKERYEELIKEVKANAMGAELNATEKAQIEEYKKKLDEIKRKIRNIDATWTKALNSEIFKTGHLSGLNPLTRDALKESLDKVAESMSKDVVAFLEDKFEQLPARADGEDGSEQYVMTNAVYLAAMCQYIGITDVSKLSDDIKRFYALLHAVTKDTLTQDAYDNNYESYVDDIINLLEIIDNVEVPDFFNKGQPDVIVEQMKPVAASIKFALGRAAYKAYTEADKRHLPNWNTIKSILDGSSFMQLYAIGNEANTFRDTDKFKQAAHPHDVLREAINNAAEAIWDNWTDIPSAKTKPTDTNRKTFDDAVRELKDSVYIGTAKYKRKGGVKRTNNNVVELSTEYINSDNTLKITAINVVDTDFDKELQDIEFKNWLPLNTRAVTIYPDGNRRNKKGSYLGYKEPTVNKEQFMAHVTDTILKQLQIDDQNDLPADVMRKLVSKGSGAQYRTFDSAEEKFNNIIDMGNPLKAIRSRYRR